jgi:hypothetical protein
VDERGGKGWRRSLQDLVHAYSGSLSFLLFFQIFRAKLGLGDANNRLSSWLGPGANPWREKDLALIKKRNGRKKERNAHMK